MHTHQGTSLRACRLHLDSVSPWPSGLHLVWRAPSCGQGFTPTGLRRGLSAVGQQGLLRAYLDVLSAVNQGKETACGSQVLVCTIAGQIWESDQLNLSFPFCVSWHPCEYTLHIHKEVCLSTVFCSVGLFVCFYTSTTSPWLPCDRCWNRKTSIFLLQEFCCLLFE